MKSFSDITEAKGIVEEEMNRTMIEYAEALLKELSNGKKD